MDPCPSLQQLQDLLDDRAGDAGELEQHVEACPLCQQALERLTAAAFGATAPPSEHGPNASISSLCDVGGGTTAPDFLRRLEQEPPRPPAAWSDGPRSAAAGSPRAEPVAARRPPLTFFRFGPQRLHELQPILRKRLLIMTVVLEATSLISAIATWTSGEFRHDPTIGITFFGALVIIAGLIWTLWRRPGLSIRALRSIELLFVACLMLHAVRYLWGAVSTELEEYVRQGGLSLSVAGRSYSLPWFMFIILYGVCVPNTLGRAAAVVTIITLAPLITMTILGLRDPALPASLLRQLLLEMASWLSVAAGVAVFGSYRLEALRQEVVAARRLGQYQLKERLGGGGMGEVFLAEHMLLRRPCAIKLIRPERAGDPKNLARFEREVQATAALTHPNTVEILDYGRADDGTFYYVMEYLPGLSLQELVERHGSLPPERTVHLLLQVAGALQEAHGAGLIHRDIKPANILICERGGKCDVAKLLDFGLVRLPEGDTDQSRLTQLDTIAGTPAYMSPEQATNSEGVDGRSDLYSLGAVAYFALTGRPPFVRPTAAETLTAHLREEVVPPSRCNPQVPADVQKVVLSCLEKDPALRFPTVAALSLALEGCDCARGWTAEQAAVWWRDHC